MLAVERRSLGLPMNDRQFDQAAREVDNGMVSRGQVIPLNRSNGLVNEFVSAQPALDVDCMELRYSIARLTDERSLSHGQQIECVELQAEEVIVSALRATVIKNPNDTLDLLAELESHKPKAANAAALLLGQTIDGVKHAGLLIVPIGESMENLEEAIGDIRFDNGVAMVADKLKKLVQAEAELIAA